MNDLFKMKVQKDDAGYYALYMSDLAHQDPDKEMQARWGKLKNSTKMVLFDRVHDAGQLITFMDYHITSLQQEIDAVKSGGGPEAIVAAEEHASELEKELERMKHEQDEALQQLKASDKELNETRGDLFEVQKLLKEAQVRAWKMDDELLQLVKALESARAELPRQTVDDYKESAGFKEGLKRMGRVTYEYGYRVALACFRSLHPDSEVEEDPFTVRPEDDLVLMERPAR
ncbi:hypothetical protein BHE74_00036221 [Ensete ventricosum]|nr:hypothetical protein BHE74_00036221 [Ensete ventricosum]